MSLFFKLAWRNIFRNKKRTIITALAIGIGVASLIYTDAIMLGMQDNMIKSLTSTYMGEAQIHNKDYRQTQKLEKTINNTNDIINNLKKEDKIDNFSKRVLAQGTISSPITMKPITINGIQPEVEKDMTKIDDAVIEGSYLKKNQDRELLIGKEMAKNLEVTVGDRIVVTVSEAETGEISQMLFRIKGIFDLVMDDIEKSMVFININTAQKMLNLKGKAHEIIVKYKDINYSKNKNNFFVKKYTKNGNEAANWPTLVPQMNMVMEMQTFSLSIVALIIFGIVVFGIFNTLFMAIYERMFEFGVMRACGTKKSGLIKLIIFEAGALSLISSIIGIILGYIFVYITMKIGIDYSGIEMAGAAFSGKLYPVLKLRQFIIYPVLIIAFTLIVSIYPAVYAGKINIANALRKSI